MNFIGMLAGIGGAIAGWFRWLIGWEHRRAGRTEAALDAATREAKRGKERAKINADVRALDPDALQREMKQ